MDLLPVTSRLTYRRPSPPLLSHSSEPTYVIFTNVKVLDMSIVAWERESDL